MCLTFNCSKDITSYTCPSNSSESHNNSKNKNVLWKKNTNDSYAAELTNLLGKMIKNAATEKLSSTKSTSDNNSNLRVMIT